MNRSINMSFNAKTSTNTLSPIGVAINQIINLVHSDAHKEVVSRLLVEALHRSHSDLEEMMHALHDYLLGYHLGGKKVAEIYINLKIFKPFPIKLDPMDDSTSLCLPYASKCLCGGIHCTEWEYDYIDIEKTSSSHSNLGKNSHIDHNGKFYLDMGSFYRSIYIRRGTSNARINWDLLDDIDELTREPEMSRESSNVETTRTPSPFYATNCFCYGCRPDYYDVDDSISCASSHYGHGYDCWCNECTKADVDKENNRLWGDIDPDFTKDDPDFSKDDRGGINYHSKRHDKREFRAKERTKDTKKQSSFKKHYKKRGARNPRTNVRRETRNSKRKRLDASSDEDENSFEMPDELETAMTPLIEYDTYDNPPLEPQEHSALENSASENFDADLPEKDDRYHRKNRHTKREKHIRDQEKMARELGIPVARKMKRRDIPTSRYNRHKEHIDREEF